MKKTLCTIAVLGALSAYAADNDNHHDEHVEHIGAHVHGEAQLNIVLDGDDLEILLESPAMNIVGFEHAPSTDEQKAVVEAAKKKFKYADKLFDITGGRCVLKDVDIDWGAMGEHDEHDEHEHHEAHDEHAHKHSEHDEHDSHEHEEHAHDHEGHSDIDGKFKFACRRARTLESIHVELFDAFPHLEKINLQWIARDKQGAQVLTPEAHELRLD